MRIGKLFLTLLLMLGLSLIVPAQTRSTRSSRSVRLSKKHPSVYITFVREAKIASVKTGEIQQTVWLRLHNNTRWPIWLDASGVPEEYGDAALYFAVDNVVSGEKLFGSTRCHVCSSAPLSPGKSIIFSLPQEYLKNDQRIRIGFRYDWENSDDAFAGREVEHSIFFSGSKLTDNAR